MQRSKSSGLHFLYVLKDKKWKRKTYIHFKNYCIEGFKAGQHLDANCVWPGKEKSMLFQIKWGDITYLAPISS